MVRIDGDANDSASAILVNSCYYIYIYMITLVTIYIYIYIRDHMVFWALLPCLCNVAACYLSIVAKIQSGLENYDV